AAQNVVRVYPDRLLGHVVRDRRMAVPVAADPRAEAQERSDLGLRQLAGPGAARATDGCRGEAVQPWREPVDRLVEDDHRGPDLVDGRWGTAAQLGGLPQDRDLLAQLATQLAVARRGQARVVRPLQEVRDPAQRDEDGAASRLRGMRREDGIDPHPGDRSPRIAAAQGAPEPRSLGRAAGGASAPRRTANAVAGLGQVDQLEVEAE